MEDYFWIRETIQTNDKIYVLIIYDIVNNRRRITLSKMLEGYGFRVQKSAFEALITEQQYGKLIDELPKMLDKAEDSIRVYRFRGYADVKLLGASSQIKNEDVIII